MAIREMLEELPDDIDALEELYREEADEENIEELMDKIVRDVTSLCIKEDGEPNWGNIEEAQECGIPVSVAGTTVFLTLPTGCEGDLVINENLPLAHPQE